MYRGTTPTLKFEIETDLDLNFVTDLWVTLKVRGQKSTYKISDGNVLLNAEESYAQIELTQEETLKFIGAEGECQLKFLTDSDKVYASPIVKVNINAILNEDIMSND